MINGWISSANLSNVQKKNSIIFKSFHICTYFDAYFHTYFNICSHSERWQYFFSFFFVKLLPLAYQSNSFISPNRCFHISDFFWSRWLYISVKEMIVNERENMREKTCGRHLNRLFLNLLREFICVTHVAPSEKINKQFKEKKTHIKKCSSEKKSASNRSKTAAKTQPYEIERKDAKKKSTSEETTHAQDQLKMNDFLNKLS